jgi:hypothetical protein
MFTDQTFVCSFSRITLHTPPPPTCSVKLLIRVHNSQHLLLLPLSYIHKFSTAQKCNTTVFCGVKPNGINSYHSAVKGRNRWWCTFTCRRSRNTHKRTAFMRTDGRTDGRQDKFDTYAAFWRNKGKNSASLNVHHCVSCHAKRTSTPDIASLNKRLSRTISKTGKIYATRFGSRSSGLWRRSPSKRWYHCTASQLRIARLCKTSVHSVRLDIKIANNSDV